MVIGILAEKHRTIVYLMNYGIVRLGYT